MTLNAKQLQKLSKEAQIKKYGGMEGYRKEMIRRGALGNSKRWKLEKKNEK